MMGKPGDRPWTGKEITILRRHYGPQAPHPLPGPRIAALLHRSVAAINCQARAFNLTRQIKKLDRLKLCALHEKGYTDEQIASRLQCSPHSVRNARRRLALPANRTKRPGPLNKTWLKEQGCDHLVDLVWMQSRLDALARWPGCVGITHCHARILELIERGVAIAQEMSRELGIGKPTVNHHLKRLRERGLIVVVGTIPTRTNPASVHALAGPALEASKQHRGQKEGS